MSHSVDSVREKVAKDTVKQWLGHATEVATTRTVEQRRVEQRRVAQRRLSRAQRRLSRACCEGNVNSLRKAIRDGADINHHRRWDGFTPLMEAVLNGSFECIVALGTIATQQGTPLQVNAVATAGWWMGKSALDLLVEHDYRGTTRGCGKHGAYYYHRDDEVQYLLSLGARHAFYIPQPSRKPPKSAAKVA